MNNTSTRSQESRPCDGTPPNWIRQAQHTGASKPDERRSEKWRKQEETRKNVPSEEKIEATGETKEVEETGGGGRLGTRYQSLGHCFANSINSTCTA